MNSVKVYTVTAMIHSLSLSEGRSEFVFFCCFSLVGYYSLTVFNVYTGIHLFKLEPDLFPLYLCISKLSKLT